MAQNTGHPANATNVLRFSVNLVQFDVVVTDRRGRHVPGLGPKDFAVLQDGKPQKLTHVEYVGGAAGKPKQEARQSVVILVDDLNVAFQDLVFLRRALSRYVQTIAQSGTTVAIVRSSGGSGAMQQFSSDPTYLLSVVNRLNWRPPGLPQSEINVFRLLGQAINVLAGFPGRKTVIWISPGLPLAVRDQIFENLRRLADEANRASVTVQTIDVRGLPAILPDSLVPDASAAKPPDFQRAKTPRYTIDGGYNMSQAVLASAADMTGGLFQHDSNDLLRQLRKAVNDGDDYYLVGWDPGPEAFKGRPGEPVAYHAVHIQMRDKGLVARSRSGYYAVVGEQGPPNEHFGAEAQMQDALFSPLRKREIDLQVAAALGITKNLEPYIRSWVQIGPQGVNFLPGSQADCSVVNIELAASPVLLSWANFQNARIQRQRTSAEVCGSARENVRLFGLAAEVRTPIEASGTYQVRVAVRNVGSDEGTRPSDGLIRRDSLMPVHMPTGSANETIEIADWRKDGLMVSGLSLGANEPFPGNDSSEGATVRAGSATDPSVRRFHLGQPIDYRFRVLRGGGSTVARLRVNCEASNVYTSPPLTVASDGIVTGTYDARSLKIGHYSLSAEVDDARRHKRQPVSQWIAFDVIQ